MHTTDDPYAWEELLAVLQPGETIEAIVFGDPGGTYANVDDEAKAQAFVPVEFRRRLLSADEARRLMQRWRFSNEFAEGYPQRTVIWTNKRVIRSNLAGEECSWLSWAPRHPTADPFDASGFGKEGP